MSWNDCLLANAEITQFETHVYWIWTLFVKVKFVRFCYSTARRYLPFATWTGSQVYAVKSIFRFTIFPSKKLLARFENLLSYSAFPWWIHDKPW